ncbi:hypothetical protein COB21_02045 [Candidatus Aerophobetes bacterium]|uniref:Glycogen synthase n=1 Tax=Aerophobetes bacterium TaxID=2030807 RepID=A0A2A4X637_UNCAE|nr:MAG: hypothetical protein COB21_02045 [Candidatus Aerophobetes bacterium]
MRILQVATEIAGIAKVGGIGDYILGLCLELNRESTAADLHIALPLYKSMDKEFLSTSTFEKIPITSSYNLIPTHNVIWKTQYKGITLHLFKMQNPDNFFERDNIYGYKDDSLRFLNFSILVLQYLKQEKLSFDIVHLHDWLTGFIAPLYKEKYRHLGVEIKALITTIHNAGYQGSFAKNQLQNFGLCTQMFDASNQLQDPKKSTHFNILKGALHYSDALTTVSKSYNKEIQSTFGFGLQSYFEKFQDKINPILNGIDTTYWHLENDPLLHKKTGRIKDIQNLKTFKQECKELLLKKLHIPITSHRPVFCIVTRLVEQKGPELIAKAMDYLAEKEACFILLGSAQDASTQRLFESLKKKHAVNPYISLNFGFDEALAHSIFAGADFTLIPSIFEPCGLTQMIALRYGTLPLVHHIGGLKDTIDEDKNGFAFKNPTPADLTHCIDQALLSFTNKKESLDTMIWNGFNHDWSWKKSAKEHLTLYKKLTTSLKV